MKNQFLKSFVLIASLTASCFSFAQQNGLGGDPVAASVVGGAYQTLERLQKSGSSEISEQSLIQLREVIRSVSVVAVDVQLKDIAQRPLIIDPRVCFGGAPSDSYYKSLAEILGRITLSRIDRNTMYLDHDKVTHIPSFLAGVKNFDSCLAQAGIDLKSLTQEKLLQATVMRSYLSFLGGSESERNNLFIELLRN